ncbi:MAG: manganese efflux pump MntP family protein, partial [Clostridiales Family XIII bacterium]|nr:manganese efflux pump MntP family protein [Clostridiales Family XIII bacterium]
DAFSVSIGNGMSMPRGGAKSAVATAAAFGIFQALMPTLGWLVGSTFAGYIDAYDHIIAPALLAFIGGKMLFEGIQSVRAGLKTPPEKELRLGALLVQAVATSIDALIVGVGFATVGISQAELAKAALLIGAVTFALSLAGVMAGKRVGGLLGPKAEILGGLVLLGIGLKIFIAG